MPCQISFAGTVLVGPATATLVVAMVAMVATAIAELRTKRAMLGAAAVTRADPRRRDQWPFSRSSRKRMSLATSANSLLSPQTPSSAS